MSQVSGEDSDAIAAGVAAAASVQAVFLFRFYSLPWRALMAGGVAIRGRGAVGSTGVRSGTMIVGGTAIRGSGAVGSTRIHGGPMDHGSQEAGQAESQSVPRIANSKAIQNKLCKQSKREGGG